MKSYERVTYTDGADGKTRTVLLEIAPSNSKWLIGFEVNKEGERIWGHGWDERKRMIMRECLIKRTPMRMNNMYAMLEVVK